MIHTKFQFQPITFEETRNEAFFRLPQQIIKNLAYKDLSSDAKIAYALIWDRRSLSLTNNWIENGLVYVKYSRQTLAEDLNCSEKTAIKIMSELRDYGLVHEKRMGLNRANLIFVGQPVAITGPVNVTGQEQNNLQVKNSKSYSSRTEDFTVQEQKILQSNHTYLNQTDLNHKSPLYPPNGGEGQKTVDAIALESKDKTYQERADVQDFPKAVADLWNAIMPHATQVKVLSKGRRKSISSRRREINEAKDLEWWRIYFKLIKSIPRLNGAGRGRYEGKVVAFDTVIRPSMIPKVFEGVYSDTLVPESPYVDKALEWLRENYPKPESVDGNTRQALKNIMPIGTTEDEKDRISQRLVEEIERYCRTDEVRKSYIKSCSNWLKSIDWQGGRS